MSSNTGNTIADIIPPAENNIHITGSFDWANSTSKYNP